MAATIVPPRTGASWAAASAGPRAPVRAKTASSNRTSACAGPLIRVSRAKLLQNIEARRTILRASPRRETSAWSAMSRPYARPGGQDATGKSDGSEHFGPPPGPRPARWGDLHDARQPPPPGRRPRCALRVVSSGEDVKAKSVPAPVEGGSGRLAPRAIHLGQDLCVGADPVRDGYSGMVIADGYGAFDALARADSGFTLAHCWAQCPSQIRGGGAALSGAVRGGARPDRADLRARARVSRDRRGRERRRARRGASTAGGSAQRHGAWIARHGRRSQESRRVSSQRGTEVAALFYSLIETAKLCAVNPKVYRSKPRTPHSRAPAPRFCRTPCSADPRSSARLARPPWGTSSSYPRIMALTLAVRVDRNDTPTAVR